MSDNPPETGDTPFRPSPEPQHELQDTHGEVSGIFDHGQPIKPAPFPEPRHVLKGGWLDEPIQRAEHSMQADYEQDMAAQVHMSAPSTNDAELDAMRLCLQACEGLNNQAKVRVCTWLTERLGAWRTAYPTTAPPPLPSSDWASP